MATLAEMLVSGATQSASQVPDLSASLSRGLAHGAELAKQAEAVQANRAALAQKQQELELAKFEKAGGWFEAYTKMPEGSAKKAFAENFIPNGLQALGIQDKIHPLNLDVMLKDSKLMNGVVSLVKQGKVPVSALGDPEFIMEKYPDLAKIGAAEEISALASEYPEALGKAETEALDREGRAENARVAAGAAADRAKDDDARAGSVALAKKVADKYADYAAGGGRAGIKSALTDLESAAVALESGTVKTGGATTKIKGFKSDDVQSMINPDMVAAKTQAQSAMNKVLRATLGAQFTEQEGVRVLNQVWDDRQPPAQNAKRVRAKIKELRDNVRDAESEFKRFGYLKDAPVADWKPKVKSQKDKVKALTPENQNKYVNALAEKLGVDTKAIRKELGL